MKYWLYNPTMLMQQKAEDLLESWKLLFDGALEKRFAWKTSYKTEYNTKTCHYNIENSHIEIVSH